MAGKKATVRYFAYLIRFQAWVGDGRKAAQLPRAICLSCKNREVCVRNGGK